jgi:hypothetical protein
MYMWHLGQVSTFKGYLVALMRTTISFWTEIPSPSFAKTKVTTKKMAFIDGFFLDGF